MVAQQNSGYTHDEHDEEEQDEHGDEHRALERAGSPSTVGRVPLG